MNEAMKHMLAVQTYNTFCAAIEKRNWKYDRDEEKLVIFFTVNGDDIPMQLILRVDEDRQVLQMMSPLPFEMSESKRIEGAIAACAASYGLADGCFEYDLSNGRIVYRVSTSFVDSILGEGVMQYMMDCTLAIVDQYNDLFLALEKGIIDLPTFIERS